MERDESEEMQNGLKTSQIYVYIKKHEGQTPKRDTGA